VASDYTDRVLEEWQAVRPDVDTAATGVVTRILRLARYLEPELNEVAAGHGLSAGGDFDTLAALRRQVPQHELSPTRLAQAALMTSGGMTSRLDRLEERGYLERHADPNDRRAVLVRLTDRGKQVVDDVLESSVASQQDLLEALEPVDRAELAQLLRHLLVYLGDE
jgi:DNA-binding MarR family transcriptional regulator